MEGLGESYRFIPLPADRKFGGTRQRMLNITNLYYFIKQILLWVWCLIRFRPAIVHYAVTDGWAMEKGLVFLALGRLLGAKTLGHLHSGVFLEFWNSLPPWRKRNAWRALQRLDGMIVLSEGWRRNLQRAIPLDAARLFVVNNPIDSAFELAAMRMSLDRPGCAILSLGALERAKGVVDLLHAAKSALPAADFNLQFVGPEREAGLIHSMEEYIGRHSLSEVVKIRKGVWGREKIEVFAQANVFVLASYFENFPLVVLEAAAAGMAIITTPAGAVPEFFEDGVSAIFVQPGDVEALAAAIRTLAGNPAERRRLACAARDVFQRRCARARIMQSLDAVYRSLTSPLAPQTASVIAHN